ncbi:hypothetical protein Ark11_0664 [Candidatus Ichthyocystis hellenicum]|uniref:Uncharacterized protein n=3 Tax=Burkholderiales genera incertae sedis TaxID=224471 RepID=A0A0S4M3F9_9BURK|nr:hypothetical protein Ark11_0664 [Candidatus Ichthyocystis hellenicum]
MQLRSRFPTMQSSIVVDVGGGSNLVIIVPDRYVLITRFGPVFDSSYFMPASDFFPVTIMEIFLPDSEHNTVYVSDEVDNLLSEYICEHGDPYILPLVLPTLNMLMLA